MDKWTKKDFKIIKERVTGLTDEGMEKLNRLHYMEIPEGIEVIMANAFQDLLALDEVYLPSTLEVIGESAFKDSCLRKVHGGENVFHIHKEAFESNFIKSLKNFKNLKVIGEYAFSSNKLEEFYFSKTLEKIEAYAFYKNNFKEVDLSETKDLVIFLCAFANNLIKKVILGENKQFNKTVFMYNELEEVVNGDVDYFEYSNINKSTNYKEACFSDLWTRNDFVINCGTFKGLSNSGEAKLINLKSITFPTISGVTRIGKNFFYERSFLRDQVESIYICEGVEVIEEETFFDTALKCIHLPDTLKEIYSQAFGCTSLTHIEIPAVEVIESGAFMASRLEKIDMKNAKIKALKERVFYNCFLLKEVILPDTLEDIGISAFSRTSSLKRIVIPENVWRINNRAFENSRLEEIVFKNPEKLHTIGAVSFNGTRIKDFPFNDFKGLERLEAGAFQNTVLENIDINKPSLAVGESAFSQNDIKKVKLNVESIEFRTFACSEIQDIEIINSEVVKEQAFYYSKIKNMKIKKLNELDMDAFEGAKVGALDIPDNTKTYRES